MKQYSKQCTCDDGKCYVSSTGEPLKTKWRVNVSFFPAFLNKGKDAKVLKQDLLDCIAPLDRGADATPEDQQRVDQLASKLEAVNPTKQPLKSDLLNGKWELIYTTSKSILQTQRPKFLRSSTNYQAINVDTLRAQNMESWPFFNQVTADLTPLNARKVAVKFDYFKIGGLGAVTTQPNMRGMSLVPVLNELAKDIQTHTTIQKSALCKTDACRFLFKVWILLEHIPIKAPGRARGELEITYLDEELRISRGDLGNLFILKMIDPSYRVPVYNKDVSKLGYFSINSASCHKLRFKFVGAHGDRWKHTNAVQESINSWLSKTQHFLTEVTLPLVKTGQIGKPDPGNEVDTQDMDDIFLGEQTIASSMPNGNLSFAAIVSIEQFCRLNGLTGQKMQNIFKALVPKPVYDDARNLVEYCCFRFLSRDASSLHPCLKEPAFQRLIFITMIAWENPYSGKNDLRAHASRKASFQVPFAIF
ncbi:hypothetical protein GOBAR_DD21930 [Gossypium barbadense]|nr:hypothetical protein GOBAR_DD21930 [Gossypium barbadense]